MATQESQPARQPPSSDVEQAEHCDAAGAHSDAIGHLASGARKHDVDAMTRLGKRLLVGDRAPCLPKDGAGLIADASARGGAEAAAVLAVLYGVGASRGHDLKAALESLTVAAERGWQPAREQLEVLAAGPFGSDESGATEAHASARDHWRSLAGTIDVAAWQSVPAATNLSQSPLIRSYPSFVGPRVCRWFIEKSRSRLSRALVYEALRQEVMAKPTRTNTAAPFSLLDTDLVLVLTQLKMSACLEIPLKFFEAATVLHYDEGEEITDHYDFVDPNIPNYAQEIASHGQRVVTFLLYLNEDYGGGETTFPRLGLKHKGARGEGLFFVNALPDGSADTRTLHTGNPPARGEKWIVSQFVRNRPVL